MMKNVRYEMRDCIKNDFDKSGIKYRINEDCPNILELYFSTQSVHSIRLIIIFDEEGNRILFRAMDFCNIFFREKLIQIVLLCNELNDKYLFAKYVVDVENERIDVLMDQFVTMENCRMVCAFSIDNLLNLVEENYHAFLKIMI